MGGQGNNLFPRNKNLFHFMVVYLKPPWSWLRGLWLWLWSPFGGSPGMAQTPWWAKEGRWWVHLRGIYLAAGGRQLPREWFKTRGEWKLRMPRRYHGGRGTHKSGTLTLSQRQPSTTSIHYHQPQLFASPLHPRPILQTSWNQISTLFPAIITTFSYNFYPALKEDHRFGSIGQF